MNKYEVLKSMNTIVKYLNNEEAYFRWIIIIPDGADDEELMDCAKDEEIFADSVSCFKSIMADYLDDGIYIDRKLY